MLIGHQPRPESEHIYEPTDGYAYGDDIYDDTGMKNKSFFYENKYSISPFILYKILQLTLHKTVDDYMN